MPSKPLRPTGTIVNIELLDALRSIEGLDISTGVPLSQFSRWRIGGVADCIVAPDSANSLASTIACLNAYAVPFIVIGSTSNLLFADEGLRAVAVQVGPRMADIRIEGHKVWCQSGAWVPGLARRIAKAGLSGAEHTCGIPGTLGGLICMNGGSQRKGIGDNLINLRAVTPEGEIVSYGKKQCSFAYRESIFQKNNNTIVDAELFFGNLEEPIVIRRKMLNILQQRKRKFPQTFPNCGSVFVSNPAMYEEYGSPGEVIERLGLKGLKVGGAEISPLHGNFINNIGGATASDVLALISKLRERVFDETGYAMRVEVKYVDPLGSFH